MSSPQAADDKDHIEVVIEHDRGSSSSGASSRRSTDSVEMQNYKAGDKEGTAIIAPPPLPESDNALEITWNDITIKAGEKKLLNQVSGRVKGRFLAIMGGSGSGKTTLLNYLARRMHKQTKASEGVSMINGSDYSNKTLKKIAGYVMQDDLLFANLTVEETIAYAGKLRLPADITIEERAKRVNDAISKLGLEHCRQTKIGDELKRGVSGGERKRVAVAMELLQNPSVLMLDEPTSGLDSASALSLCETLKGLAAAGECTVICTIHQPQTKIFNLFDELIILNKGHVLYQGPRDEILPFYEEAGLPCPAFTNPADHILDVVTYVSGCDEKQLINNQRALEKLNRKKHSEKNGNNSHKSKTIDSDEVEKAMKEWKPPRINRTPWTKQFVILCRRSIKETIRNRTVMLAQVLQNVIMAVLLGTVFLQIGNGQSSATRRQPVLFFCVVNQGMFGAITIINSFPSERKIVLRERAAGSYYASAYFMAKIVSETLVQLTSPIVFSIIVYPLVGLQHGAGRFFIFMAFMVLCCLAATSIALFISAVCRTTTLAVSILPAALEVARLYGGFLLSPANLPKYFAWLDALSYCKYAYVGIALNELTGLVLTCKDSERNAAGNCPIQNGEQTIRTLGLDVLTIEACAGVLIAMIVFFRVGAYLAIRYIKW
jgi:ATP-binding cassette subfamily G (WHITE) protein 2